MEKDQQIYSQYQALSSLKNITYIQNTLNKAKETALKILQNTVYEMVEKIAQCRLYQTFLCNYDRINFSNVAIEGLQREIKALEDQNQPMSFEIEELKKTLFAFKEIPKFEAAGKEHKKVKKVTSIDCFFLLFHTSLQKNYFNLVPLYSAVN